MLCAFFVCFFTSVFQHRVIISVFVSPYLKQTLIIYFLCPISLGRYVYTSPCPCPMPSAMVFSKLDVFLVETFFIIF